MADEGDKLVAKIGPVSFLMKSSNTLLQIIIQNFVFQMLKDLHTYLEKVSDVVKVIETYAGFLCYYVCAIIYTLHLSI